MTQLNKTPFTIRAKRGTAAQIESTSPVPYQLQGEFAYATDTEQLYMSNGSAFIAVTDGYLTEANAAAEYLKLDTSNDPLTGDLEISNASPKITLTNTGANGKDSRIIIDDTADSITRYGQAGQPSGSPQAYQNDAGNNYLSAATSSAFNFERTDSFSIEAWIKFDSFGTYGRSIFVKMQSGFRGYSFYVASNGSLYLDIVNTSTTNWIRVASPTSTVTTGSWQHVAVTYDGSSSASGITFYKNGSALSLTSYGNNLTSTILNSGVGEIGSISFYAYRQVDGLVDELVIYDKELSLPEIQASYNSGSGTYHTADTNIVGIYHLEGNGDDSSGNGYDMTWTGTPDYGVGKVIQPPLDTEALIWSLEDGLAAGEKGILTVGDESGKTVIEAGTGVYLNDNTHVLSDTDKLYFGAGDDASITFDGSDLRIDSDANLYVASKQGTATSYIYLCPNYDSGRTPYSQYVYIKGTGSVNTPQLSTNNSYLYWLDSGMKWTSSAGNLGLTTGTHTVKLGIGTLTPSETLDVVGDVEISADLHMLSDGGKAYFGAGDDASIDCDATNLNITSSNAIKTIGGIIRKTTRVTTTYTILTTDDIIYCNTDGGAFTVTLPVGVEGQTFRIINCGSSSNDLTIAPNGAELLTGVNASKTASDGTVIMLTYNTTEGWW